MDRIKAVRKQMDIFIDKKTIQKHCGVFRNLIDYYYHFIDCSSWLLTNVI